MRESGELLSEVGFHLWHSLVGGFAGTLGKKWEFTKVGSIKLSSAPESINTGTWIGPGGLDKVAGSEIWGAVL